MEDTIFISAKDLTPDYLEHHGVKGQKWGVRRYQNSDGNLTAEGRQRQLESRNVSRNKPYTDDVNDIVRTLSKKERDFLGAADNEDWIDKKYERDTLVNKAKTFVSKEGDTPVSFVEIWTDGGRTGQISLATRNDPKYRGKGYASKNVEQAIKWADRYGNKSIDELEWIADRKNTASVYLGKKYGFVEDDPNKHGHNWKDDWSEEYAIMYRPIKKKAKPTQLAHHYIYDDYLEHHGVLGMKWGVRRYQNKDGSLTSSGRSHYGVKSRIKKTVKKDVQKIKKVTSSKDFKKKVAIGAAVTAAVLVGGGAIAYNVAVHKAVEYLIPYIVNGGTRALMTNTITNDTLNKTANAMVQNQIKNTVIPEHSIPQEVIRDQYIGPQMR